MANRFINPSLADISQDIAGIIPVDLIKKWENSKKSAKSHSQLLEPFIKKGFALSSDSAGLSRLTASKSLLEVLKLVSQPKEIIYSYCKKIGGQAIGVWAADNTQVFFPEEIDTEEILKQIAAAQSDIQNLSVQVGMGLHFGEFIDIGGGLFGEEADFIEEVAENHTSAGEIVLSQKIIDRLPKSYKKLITEAPDLSIPGIFRLNLQKFKARGEKDPDIYYPTPFPQDFYDGIRASDESEAAKVYAKYQQEKIVILVKIKHTSDKLILNILTKWTLANTILKRLTLVDGVTEVKSNGALGIFVADSVDQAIEFSNDTRDTLKENGYDVTIGLSKGEILLFPMPGGYQEIAGGPVNIASKLAEDFGEKYSILIHDSLDLNQVKLKKQEFTTTISRVELKGVKI